jgi:hypothetical protein
MEVENTLAYYDRATITAGIGHLCQHGQTYSASFQEAYPIKFSWSKFQLLHLVSQTIS